MNKSLIVTALALVIAAGTAAVAETITQSDNVVVTVSYPLDFASKHTAVSFVRDLGMPTNGSCDKLAKHLNLDPDSVMIASNRNGEALCLLDDVEVVKSHR